MLRPLSLTDSVQVCRPTSVCWRFVRDLTAPALFISEGERDLLIRFKIQHKPNDERPADACDRAVVRGRRTRASSPQRSAG